MVTARGRSKSVGRATPKARGKSPSRSRSRSRVAVRRKDSRTPATDSKVRRRPSPSSTASSGSSTPRDRTPSRKQARGPNVSSRSSHASKIENIRREWSTNPRTVKPSSSVCSANFWSCIPTFFRETVCPSAFLALSLVLTFVPAVLWLNLLLFSPQVAAKSSLTASWGPTSKFFGALWPTDWRVYFDYRCHAFVLVYLFLHYLIARFVPIDLRKTNFGESRRSVYKANGLIALIVFAKLFAVAQFGQLPFLQGLKPSVLLPKYWIGLLMASGHIGTLFALLAYVASGRLPRSQCTSQGNFIVDLWVGRASRPKWLGVDWKVVICRPGTIGLFLIELTCLCIQWENYKRISHSLALLVALHFIQLIDSLLFEHTTVSSNRVTREGFGYWTILGALISPFVIAVNANYLLSKPDLGNLFLPNGSADFCQWATSLLALVLFLVGYWIYRGACHEKFIFRYQPHHPRFSGMTKVSNGLNQRLLAGGWWGFVRYPVCLGILLMDYAIALIAGFTSIMPWVYPVLSTMALLHYIWRTEYLREEKFASSWGTYKKLVPYKLVPPIY